MTTSIRAATAAVATLATTFLAGAFILWEINPGQWTETARFFVALFGSMFAAMAATAIATLP